MENPILLNVEKKIANLISVKEEDILNIYIFGSHLYGCANPSSDYDLLVVVDNFNGESFLTSEKDNLDLSVYNPNTFQLLLNEHFIVAILTQFLPSPFILMEKRKFSFKLNLAKLRSSVSKESHRLWVKARKKFTLENNKPLGRKNIVNTMREWMFAIQLVETGTIHDFGVANDLRKQINLETEENWEYYENKYKPMFKEFHKKFKAITPKDKAEEVIREHVVNDSNFVEKYNDRINLKNKEEQ